MAITVGGFFELGPGPDAELVDGSRLLVVDGDAAMTVRHRPCSGKHCATAIVLGARLLGDSDFRPPGRRASVRLTGTTALLFQSTLREARMRRPRRGRLARLGGALACAVAQAEGDTHRPKPDLSPAHLDHVRRARELLALRLSDSLSLQEIADAVGCSRFYLCRIFRAATGASIGNYVRDLRLNEALRRLAQCTTPIGRLAADLGFASHSRFCSEFRKRYGMTPTDWLRSPSLRSPQPSRGMPALPR